MSQKSEQTADQPGADRFWGQFSQSRAGRTNSGDETGHQERPEDGPSGDAGGHCLEWCPICRSAELFRTAVPPELRQQAESIQQEAIGVLRAFLDAYAEKSGEDPRPPAAAGAGPAGPDEPEDPPEPRVTEIPLE